MIIRENHNKNIKEMMYISPTSANLLNLRCLVALVERVTLSLRIRGKIW